MPDRSDREPHEDARARRGVDVQRTSAAVPAPVPGLSNSGIAALARAVEQAPAASLQRAPRGGTAKKSRDPSTLSREELEAEIDRTGKQAVNTDPDDPRWQKYWDRSQELYDELQEREDKAEAEERLLEGYGTALRLVAEADQANQEIGQFVEYANERLTGARGQITEYLGYYTGAYKNFSEVLEEAREDAAEREAMMSAISGLVIGTGLGLAAGAMFRAAQGLTVVIGEVGSELQELMVGKSRTPPPEFKPPPGIEPAGQAAVAWERLAEAWTGVGMLNTTLLWFGDYRVAIQAGLGDLGAYATGGYAEKSADDLVGQIKRIGMQAVVPRMKSRIDEARGALDEFVTALRHPVLRRLEYEIEQDLWIQWMSGLKRGGPPNPYGFQLPGMDSRVQDALDEDAVEERLERLGLIGERSRLDVDFGMNTTRGDTEDAYEAAVKVRKRTEQLGAIGVAVRPVTRRAGGVVHIYPYAYERAGIKPPAGPVTEGYFRAVPYVSPSQAGQLVRVQGAGGADGFEVEPLYGAEPTGVTSGEEQEAKDAV